MVTRNISLEFLNPNRSGMVSGNSNIEDNLVGSVIIQAYKDLELTPLVRAGTKAIRKHKSNVAEIEDAEDFFFGKDTITNKMRLEQFLEYWRRETIMAGFLRDVAKKIIKRRGQCQMDRQKLKESK